MKKITSLLMMFMLFVGMGWAQPGSLPVVGKSFYLTLAGKDANGNYLKLSSNGSNITWTPKNRLDAITFVIEKDGAEVGAAVDLTGATTYKIKCDANGKYLNYSAAEEGPGKIGFADNSTAAKTDWKIVSNVGATATGAKNVIDIVPGEITEIADNSLAFNFHGGLTNNNTLGFYARNDNNSAWMLEEPRFVNDLQNIDVTKCYTLIAPRSGLAVENAKSASATTTTSLNIAFDQNDSKQQFAFVKHGQNYYLYSVLTKSFMWLNSGMQLSKTRVSDAVAFEKVNGTNKVILKVGTNYINLQDNGGVVTNGYHTADPGNTFLIEEVPGSHFVHDFKPVASTLSEGDTFGDNMHWYTMSLGYDNGGMTYPNLKYMENGDIKSRAEFNNDVDGGQLFAFVGDNSKGYQIYNFAAGAKKLLWSVNPTNNELLSFMDKGDGEKRWVFEENKRGNELGLAVKAVRTDKANAYLSRKAPENLGYWVDANAKQDNNGRFYFTEVTTADIAAAKSAAEFVPTTYTISYTDAAGVKHYLGLDANNKMQISEEAQLFKLSNANTTDGFSSEGVYYMTINGYRISNYDDYTGLNNFKTVKITEQEKAEGVWHSQVITYNKFLNKYAIRCTNAIGSNYNCAKFITHNASNGLTASEENLANYQWDIEMQSPYPFVVTEDDANPLVYRIYPDRDFNEKWFTLNANGLIDLRNKAEGDFNQFFYFKEVKDGENTYIQVYPVLGKNLALGNNEPQSTGGTGKIQTLDNGTNKWAYVSCTVNKNAFGLKVIGNNSVYMSNHSGKNNPMGLYTSGPNDDSGSRLIAEPVLNYTELVAAVNAKAAKKANLQSKLEGKANHVGYPVNTEEGLTKLKAVVDGNTLNDKLACGAIYDEVVAEILAAEISKPVAGKAYVFRAVTKSGETFYLKSNGTNGGKFEAEATDAEIFVCQKVDNKFVFVNNNGKFFVAINKRTENGNVYSDNYAANTCAFEINAMKVGGHIDNVGNENLLGLVSLKTAGRASTHAEDAGHAGCITLANSGALDLSDSPYFSGSHTSAFVLEEVSYANNPKLNAIEGNMVSIAGQTKISTFSAPFATVIPANVKAFYIKKADKKENTAILTAVEGQNIPANTGVILTSNDETLTNALMVPSTETVAAIADNALAHSAGADKVFTTEEAKTFYLLGKHGANVGFFLGNAGTLKMNKAYLPVANAQAQAIKLVFGDEVTGIEGVEAEENVNAPIYDLSGRRVLSTVKGGIYIQNGKKFIVK